MDGSVVIGVRLDTNAFEQSLLELRQNAGQTTVQVLQPLLQSLTGLSAAFLSSAGTGQRWASGIGTLFQQVRNGAAAMFPGMLSAGQYAGAGFLSGLSQANGTAAGQVLATNVILGFVSGGYTAAGCQTARSLAEGLYTGGGTVTPAAASLSAWVRSAFSGGWYAVGYQISAGIASGVRGGSSLISSAAVSAARSALSAAKRALGVRSPSRVFRDQVGRMIPAGMAQGIAAGAPEVEQILRLQSQRLVQTARQDVAPSIQILPSGHQAPVVTGKQEVRVTVETPLYLDGREMARATARYMGRQLLWEAT